MMSLEREELAVFERRVDGFEARRGKEPPDEEFRFV